MAAYWGEYFSTGNVYTLTDETTYERAMYVNENTTIAEAQKNGYSTGVVFKGTATILKAYERKFATTSHEEAYVEKIAWSTEDLKEDDLYICIKECLIKILNPFNNFLFKNQWVENWKVTL